MAVLLNQENFYYICGAILRNCRHTKVFSQVLVRKSDNFQKQEDDEQHSFLVLV